MYVPSLRLERSELKCKSGCDYFGNPQWKGYCSKCHREQLQRQRTTKKTGDVEVDVEPVVLATPPPAAERKDKERGKPTQSSFSKFEEKRLRQTDSLKKTNILKFSVFRKTNTDEQEKEATVSGGSGEAAGMGVSVPPSVLESQRRDFGRRFGALGENVERDLRRFVYNFILGVLKHAHTKTIDELSERVQCHYQLFVRRMENSAHYKAVDADTRELLIDFVEKHAMTYLHSHVFSLGGAEEERADRKLQARIRQLGWLCPQHLDCRITHTHAHCRQLLYDAINELMSMDGRLSPGGKLACVRRCCACVVALVSAAAGAPASADDLLPALIFTVLKANPPRLVSNINYVTRFCNANRIMTGERGYYFTNLCCAVSFIENLTAESLSMPRDEFNCYMTMPATIGGSSWAAALSLCDNAREATAQRRTCAELDARAVDLASAARTLYDDIETFHDEIGKKATTVLKRTPLEMKPHVPPLGLCYLLPPTVTSASALPELVETPQPQVILKQSLPTEENQSHLLRPEHLSVVGTEQPTHPTSATTSPCFLLTPDDLATPDELAPTLTDINYDIDLSDLSADNSAADEASCVPQAHSLLDDNESPSTDCLLPAPLLPSSTQ